MPVIVLLLAGCLFGQSLMPPGSASHDFFVMFGQTLIVVGVIGRLWSTLYIGGRKRSGLATTGPYSVSRNPLYLFSTIAAAGIGALTGSVVAMLLFGLVCAGAFHVVILREEKYLSANLGGAYDRYKVSVPRFIPALSLYQEEKNPTFEPNILTKALFDSLAFLAAVPAFKTIEIAQQAGLLPILFRLP